MGVSRTVGELNAKIDRWSTKIEEAPREAVEKFGEELRAAVERNYRLAMGGDLKLSGTRTSKKAEARAVRRLELGKGPLGDDVKVVFGTLPGSPGKAEGFVRVRGPAQLVESDVARHFVFPDSARAEGIRSKTRSFRTGEFNARGKEKRKAVDVRAFAAGLGLAVNVGRARLKFGNTFLVRTEAQSKGRKPFRRAVDRLLPQASAPAADVVSRATDEAFR